MASHNKRIRIFCILFSLFFSNLFATDLNPWYGRDLEIETNAIFRYQRYYVIKTPSRNLRYHSNDQFYTVNAGLSAFDFRAELEATLANTRKQNPAFDNARLTVRYKVWNDILGDFLTLTPGITLTQACKHSVHDLSSFHHGKLEAEFHLAFGREFSCAEFWYRRFWGVVGIGTADVGSPWLRGDFNWEENWCDQQQLRLFILTLWGLGGNNIHCRHSFKGYGPIHHQSIDLGVGYSYLFEFGAKVSLDVTHRVYAYNFPSQANQFVLSVFYPFGF